MAVPILKGAVMAAAGVGMFVTPALAGPSGSTVAAGPWPVVELRQYTLHEGKRDTLIDLFEREFIESQEAEGMGVIGTFIDLDRPDRFVWIRGFRDMESRAVGLESFYGGPVWKAHRDAANATMIDSDNVLLLRAPTPAAEFQLGSHRPAIGEQVPAGLVVATIEYLGADPATAGRLFDEQVRLTLARAGIPMLGWFISESSPNNFPRLPVREGEKVLVWFSGFKSEAEYRAHRSAMGAATAALAQVRQREPEVLRLEPTVRSALRGPVGPYEPAGH